MTEEQVDQVVAAVQRVGDLLIATTRKVIDVNPAWESLPVLLSKDELCVYFGFVETMANKRVA